MAAKIHYLISWILMLSFIFYTIGNENVMGNSSESSVQVTTDKNIYFISEPIKITIDGILDDYVFTSEPSFLITDYTGNNVFESLIQCIPRDPWISLPYTWIWNQKYKLYDNRSYGFGKEIPPSGEQVPPEKYYAWFDYNGVNKVGPAEFEIIKPEFTAAIDIDPNTLDLKSKGRWITSYITLNYPYDVNDIDISTIRLEDTIPTEWGDIQGNMLMVKFDRSEVEDILSVGTYNLKVTGELTDGTSFEGYSDEIRIIDPGK